MSAECGELAVTALTFTPASLIEDLIGLYRRPKKLSEVVIALSSAGRSGVSEDYLDFEEEEEGEMFELLISMREYLGCCAYTLPTPPGVADAATVPPPPSTILIC